ncbi:dynamin family protein [Desulfosoma caldarium]|uniref:Dynamin family protein n=1 Tax=Desulfosoma caldarium TaxID=610254 RepID=A0A3N1UPV4_9BACT|nr:dynamin family protein [Desulfosoma caldarium]ROQ89921.1 dynamin family protein [Desulfosoma caldarium]
MLEHYRKTQAKLLKALDDIQQLTTINLNAAITDRINVLYDKIRQSAFYLVVLGEFKRGKSTLINAVLKDNLLPTAVVPLTSIVTMIHYGPEEKICVRFKDGTTRTIPRKALADYVTERGNPDNVKGVDRVEISYPADTLRGGVHLIDTPGVGSIFETNTQATYDFLPQVDAALFLFTADPPLSRSELAFLRDVCQYVTKIFFIQNKIDVVAPEDREESLAFSQQILKDTLKEDEVRILPLSAKLALEGRAKGDEAKIAQSYFPQLEDVLTQFLTQEKGRVLLQSGLQSARKILNDLEFSAKLEQKAIEMPLEDLEQKIALFHKELRKIQREREENGYYFEAEIKRIMDWLDRELKELQKERLPELVKQLQDEGEKHQHIPISQYVEKMEDCLSQGIIHTFDDWIVRQEKALNEEFARVSRQYSDRTNQVIDRLIEASAKLFDIPFQTIQSDESLRADSRFYYLLGDPPRFFDIAGAVDFFSRKILPKSFSQKKVLADLMKKLPERIDANCGRVRADFMRRLQESFLEFRWNLNAKIDATAKGIQDALDKAVVLKKAESAERDKKKLMLHEAMQSILRVKTDLEEIALEVA